MKKCMKLWLLAAALALVCLLAACSAKPLAAPETISYDGSIITWPAVENADGYVVKINDGEE